MELFGIERLPFFFLSSFILCLIPGVDMVFILGKTFTSPNKHLPLMAVLGITCGLLVHTSLVAFGLGLFLAHSPLAFNTIRFLGAVYLERELSDDKRPSLFQTWFQGFCVNILNPKVVIFFFSYLPQFIIPDHSSMAFPLLLLGGMFCVIGTFWNMFLVFAGTFIRACFLNKSSRMIWTNRMAGMIFILLAVQIFAEILFF
ncbi:MAG: LysE family translocator [Planctomycetia bacterium]|nr:LysE family translocator [Planctomycetia bacterium]